MDLGSFFLPAAPVKGKDKQKYSTNRIGYTQIMFFGG